VQDLNDLFYFTQVVYHGGFAAAGRALRIPKSKLSRRVAELEKRLNARLIERTARRFAVTEIGKTFYEQSQIAVAAAERAQALVAASIAEPVGVVRFSCPTGLTEIVAPMLRDFLTLYPRAQIRILAIDRPVDLIAERVDVALRVRVKLDTDAALIMRTLAYSRRILVASSAQANSIPSSDISKLAKFPTLHCDDSDAAASWTLEGPNGQTFVHTQTARVGCGDFATVREAAISGLGIAFLPDHFCAPALNTGALVRVFPEWRGENGIVHLVFTTRTGLPPLVRAWIEHIAARFTASKLFSPGISEAKRRIEAR